MGVPAFSTGFCFPVTRRSDKQKKIHKAGLNNSESGDAAARGRGCRERWMDEKGGTHYSEDETQLGGARTQNKEEKVKNHHKCATHAENTHKG